ncbi:hypothetical protein D3C73_984820 [compost metagenome]
MLPGIRPMVGFKNLFWLFTFNWKSILRYTASMTEAPTCVPMEKSVTNELLTMLASVLFVRSSSVARNLLVASAIANSLKCDCPMGTL